MKMLVADMDSPAGAIRVATNDGEVTALGFVDHWDALAERVTKRLDGISWTNGKLEPAIEQRLLNYFDGDATALNDIPTRLFGTDFQQQVWSALRQIPFGQTCSYLELAKAIGNPKAIRAVGTANGANPVSIIVPCHRVINTGGSLGGYAGGLERKRWLLNHESANAFSLVSSA